MKIGQRVSYTSVNGKRTAGELLGESVNVLGAVAYVIENEVTGRIEHVLPQRIIAR